MLKTNPIRTYRQHWRALSPTRKQEVRTSLLVIFSSTPFLLLILELPIYIPDTAISAVSAILLGIQVAVVGMSTRIKLKPLRHLAFETGFISIFLLAFSLLLSEMQTAFRVLSTDYATLGFKLAGITFTFTVLISAIGFIRESKAKPKRTGKSRISRKVSPHSSS